MHICVPLINLAQIFDYSHQPGGDGVAFITVSRNDLWNEMIWTWLLCIVLFFRVMITEELTEEKNLFRRK